MYALKTTDVKLRNASAAGETKTASVGSVSRIPAADIEDIVVKSLKEHVAAQRDESTAPCGDLTRPVAEIVVHKDELVVRLE